jgi:hypothetical protein
VARWKYEYRKIINAYLKSRIRSPRGRLKITEKAGG